MRLYIACRMVWLAAHIAPRRMWTLFLAYRDMLRGFSEQRRVGRTYGVVSAVWGDDKELAERIRAKGTAAMRRERTAIAKATRS